MLKAAVIGLGRIGALYDKGIEGRNVYSHTKAFLLNNSVELVAVCDSEQKKREQFAATWGKRIQVYDSFAELNVQNQDIDIYSICTPTQTHQAYLEQILDTDAKLVICEKPLINNLDALEGIAGLSKSYAAKGMFLVVNHGLRWEPSVLEIKRRLQKTLCQAVYVSYAKGLLHNGIHVVDLTLYFFGEPEAFFKVSEFLEVAGDPTCDFVFIYKDFNVYFNGLREQYYSIFEYVIYTRKGKIQITDLTEKSEMFSVVAHPYLEGYSCLSMVADDLNSQQYRNMACVIDDCVIGVLKGDDKMFRCKVNDAIQSMRYIKRIRELKCQKS